MATASVALVGDNAFFGFVSPIRGGRYRFAVERTTGTLNFATVTADWRRYFAPAKNLTVAVRGLHYGRYGLDLEPGSQGTFSPLRELFLGFETFIRGYAFESFDATECGEPIQGLPAGTYGIKFTTPSQYDQDLPNQSIPTGGAVVTTIPADGVITIHGVD